MMNTCHQFSENAVEDPDDARNKVTDKQSSKHSNNGWGSVHQKYQEYRTKLLGWIATYYRVKEKAKYNFVDTDYAMKLYNNQDLDLREPKLSDFYKPSTSQKQGEMIYVGGMALALGLATTRFL